MSTDIVSLKNVTCRYAPARESAMPALEAIDLEIAAGEFVGVVGANGSGKSTLARLLNGLLRPVMGEVLVDGLSTATDENLDRIRETVGMVFQNPDSQIVATSVEDDIAFGPENLGLPAAEIERRVDDACHRFGIESLRRRQPHWLSGGQKQRTVLAGVLALKPRVLVLDEPTSMLDARSQRQFRALVEALWREGTTVIYITQIMEEVATAPRVVALAAGKIAFDGTPGELFTDPNLLAATGLEPPLAGRLAAGISRPGRPLPLVLTLADLVRSVCGSN